MIFVSLLGLSAQAAEPPPAEQHVEHTVVVAGGYGGRVGSANLRYSPAFAIDRARRLRIGPQLRLVGFFGSDLRMATVDTDNVGDGGPDEDALEVDRLSVGALNLGLSLQLQLGQRWHLGLNLDVVGLPAGGGGATFVAGDTRVAVDAGSPVPSLAFTRGQVTSDHLTFGYSPVSDRLTLLVAWNQSGMELLTREAPTPDVAERRYERTVTMAKLGVAIVLP